MKVGALRPILQHQSSLWVKLDWSFEVSVPSCSFGQTPIWPLFSSNVCKSDKKRRVENWISRFLIGKSGRDCKSWARFYRVRLNLDEAI
jgi:hypothetical protein